MIRKIMVLGHRGYRAKYPENTLLGFAKALEEGADGIECDVQKTKDNHYVIIHDDSIDRVSGRSGKIADMALDALRSVDIGQAQSIPTLLELLQILPKGKYANIELKEETLTTADCPSICDMLLAHLDRRSIMVSSFEHSLLPYFRRRGVTTGMLLGEKHIGMGMRNLAQRIAELKPDSMNLPVQIFKRESKYLIYALIVLMKALRKKIAFWTVNTEAQFRLVNGVSDIIITDEVAGILTLMGRH